MPSIVKVQVLAARNLPVMDRSSDSTDCFVEIRLGQIVHRTEVCKKTLNPEWDSNWYTYNVDDSELLNEPLSFKIMDYDQYSAHDAIGRVYLTLDGVLYKDSLSYPSLDGWYPIYDTLHGIRGEIHIKVMTENLAVKEFHRFKQLSSELMLFSGCVVPEGYSIEAVIGFVEELVVNDDPEYQWIDRIRPPRASNESRQQVFLKLSGELQKKIRMKAAEAGGNAVIGFRQCFDLEGESGIVVRGIGTSVSLKPVVMACVAQPQEEIVSFSSRSCQEDCLASYPVGSTPQSIAPDHSTVVIPRIRKLSSSDSDGGGLPSSSGKFGTSLGSGGGGITCMKASTSEFNFFTLKSFIPGFIKSICGIVTAYSVKLLDDINNPDEPETRDAWWMEIRHEVKSHCFCMNCDAVIGYSETTSICDGLCVFAATGTAVVTSSCDTAPESPDSQIARGIYGLLSHQSTLFDQVFSSTADVPNRDSEDHLSPYQSSICSPCHVNSANCTNPHPGLLTTCAICRSEQVPFVLLSTAEIPPNLAVRGEGCLVQARVCDAKKRLKSEDDASYISNKLPFLEYSLHGRLLNKLKLKGMNAIFGLDVQISVGETMIIGTATGTGVYLEALPSPSRLWLQETLIKPVNDSLGIQTKLDELRETNEKKYKLCATKTVGEETSDGPSASFLPQCSDHNTEFYSNKDVKAFEVNGEKLKFEDVHDLINDCDFPEELHFSSLSFVPGVTKKRSTNVTKVISVVSKHVIDTRATLDQQFNIFMNNAVQTAVFRVRPIIPCVITNITFQVEIPDDDEIQVTLSGVATRLLESHGTPDDRHGPKKPQQVMHSCTSERRLDEAIHFFDQANDILKDDFTANVKENECPQFFLSPMPHVNGYVLKYLSAINLFLIRETTSIKELGGMNSFLRTFICEAHALARAHVLSLGGSALVNYNLKQFIVIENHHKNQGQCLLNLTGDAAQILNETQL